MEKHAAADLDDLTAFLARSTGPLLRSSGEGAHLVEQAVADGARAFGGSVPCRWHRRHSRSPRRTAVLAPSPCTASREVFRLDQVAALKPLLAGLRAAGSVSRRRSAGRPRSRRHRRPTRGG
ncbi:MULTISPECIES: hypothetical protein [unclassified Streptomyces]|uniref:hypothetical protein n=1 Tax=unclassified Streptomyces TaxID=2593676 RepID=UPI002DD971C0|nr:MULTISPECIES: hypothetical protein [unclassified Streptomyces]WSD96828.1 hypothetical protein OG758_23300 [Streptomyces sp. NBC_01474]